MTSEATFIAAIVVILLASRLLGEAAQRFRQPAVVGQLGAGMGRDQSRPIPLALAISSGWRSIDPRI
jgi:predicted Kef-type K+ transport protein